VRNGRAAWYTGPEGVAALLLFAYGTLCNAGLMAELLGRPVAPPRPARLAGYRSVPTRQGYPALFPAPGKQTPGLLLLEPLPE